MNLDADVFDRKRVRSNPFTKKGILIT